MHVLWVVVLFVLLTSTSNIVDPFVQNDKGKCKLDVSSTEETREQNMQMTN